MASVELATAYITLAASTAGIGKDIARELRGAESTAAKAGKNIGAAIRKGVEDSGDVKAALQAQYDDIERNEKKIQAIKDRSAKKQIDLAEKVREAEARLEDIQAKGGDRKAPLIKAENDLARARRRLADESSNTEGQINLLNGSIERSRAKIAELEGTEKKASKTHADYVNAAERDFARMSGAVSGAVSKSKGALGSFRDAVRNAFDFGKTVFKGDFSAAFAPLTAKAKDAARAVSTGFANVFGGFRNGIANARSALGSFADNARASATRASSAVTAAFKGTGASVRAAMSGDFKTAFAPVRSAASQAAEGVKSTFKTAGEASKSFLQGNFKSAFITVNGAARQAAGSIPGAFSSVKGRIKSTISGAFDGMKSKASAAGRESGTGFGNAFKGALGAVGIYAGFDQAAELFKGAVSNASNLEQSVGGVDAIFKDSAGQMHKWAKSAKTAVGISEDQYNSLASVLGASLKNGGVAMDELGTKTNDLIGLGADLASMFGGTTAEAVEAIQAALRGESDPIEKYGISIGEAAMKSEALKLGIKQVDGAFTDQQKKILVQSLLFKQSADAQGNFARESDTFAHKQQVLAASWEDMSAKIGGLFLPVLSSAFDFISTYVAPVLDEFVGGLTAFGEAWKYADGEVTSSGFAGFMERVAYALVSTKDVWGPVASGIAIVGGAFLAYRGAALLASAATTLFSGAFQAISWPVVATVAAIGLLVGGLILMYNKVGWFRDGVNAAWEWIKGAAQAFGDWFGGVFLPWFGSILTTIGNWFTALWQQYGVPAWNWIKGAAENFANWFINVAVPWISTAVTNLGNWFTWLWQNIIVPAWNGITAAISWAWNNIVKPIFIAIVWVIQNVLAPVFTWLWQTIIVPVWNGIVSVISWAWNTFIKPILSALWLFIRDILAPALVWLWQNVVVPVWNAISAVISWAWNSIIKPVFSALVWVLQNIVGPVFKWLYENIVKPVFNLIRIAIEFAWGIIKVIFDAMYHVLKDVLGPAFRWLWDNVVKPVFSWISDKIANTWNWLRDNVFKPWGEYLSGPFMDFWRSARDGIGKVWDGIKEIVKKPIKFVVDTVINDGLIGGYNKLNDFWSGKDLDRIKLGFSRGGVIPGYQSQKKDEVLTPMRKGEGVIVPEATRVLGAGFIHGLNAAANRAGTAGASSWLSQNFGAGYAKGGVISPLKGKYGLSQGYNRIHKGIDIAVPTGTPIYATADGVISHAGPGARAPGVWGGNEIHVSSGGIERWFAHLSEIAVRVGQKVSRGQYLGKSGNTGISSGPHLHFGVFRGGWPNDINPLDYLGGAVNFDQTAGGGGGGGGLIESVLSGFADLIKSPIEAARKRFEGNGWIGMPIGLAEKALDGLKNKAIETVSNMFGGDPGSGGNNNGGGGAERWRSVAAEALRKTGDYSESNLNALLRRLNQESGGNPRAINLWDSNARLGIPSKGLMQVIEPTFRANAWPGYDKDIYDPMSNILASIVYTKRTYPSLTAGWGRKGGYSHGGIVDHSGLSGLFNNIPVYDNGGLLHEGYNLIEHRSSVPDKVLNEKQWRAMYETSEAVQRGAASTPVTVNVSERDDIAPDTFGRRLGEGLSYELRRAGLR